MNELTYSDKIEVLNEIVHYFSVQGSDQEDFPAFVTCIAEIIEDLFRLEGLEK